MNDGCTAEHSPASNPACDFAPTTAHAHRLTAFGGPAEECLDCGEVVAKPTAKGASDD